jgi:long-chain-fatty-acid---luciferin-component ligase
METDFQMLKNRLPFPFLIDSVMGNISRTFYLDIKKLRQIRFDITKELFQYHYDSNPIYRDHCERRGVRPAELKTPADIGKVPVIPSTEFKKEDSLRWLTCPLEEVELELHSSGTTGQQSINRRSRTTLDRVSVSVTMLFREFFRISKGVGYYLTPVSTQIPRLSLIRTLGLFQNFFNHSFFFIENKELNSSQLLKTYEEHEALFCRHILGPPFAVVDLLHYLRRIGRKLVFDPESFVINLGGWKRRSGETIERNIYKEMCQEWLGIDPCRIRDIFGVSEGNLTVIECEKGKFHVPPWGYVSIRNPQNPDEELPAGETGLMCLFDNVSDTCPPFLITDDLAQVSEDTICECGRAGQLITLMGKSDASTKPGGALHIERYMMS